MLIGKWGNSLAVRLPRELIDRFDLKEGDAIDADIVAKALEETNAAAVQARKQAALEEIRKRRIPLPKDWKFDREEANWRPAFDKW
ncbi:MAG: AbrB/MazE/SpoVT family DNA-binding domain-containing protein [Sphingopyxis sp.]|nr:AbrB/MazE/SpoVT family DNA-binding domain-containing protein [Sphingopyxis sp.]